MNDILKAPGNKLLRKSRGDSLQPTTCSISRLPIIKSPTFRIASQTFAYFPSGTSPEDGKSKMNLHELRLKTFGDLFSSLSSRTAAIGPSRSKFVPLLATDEVIGLRSDRVKLIPSRRTVYVGNVCCEIGVHGPSRTKIFELPFQLKYNYMKLYETI